MSAARRWSITLLSESTWRSTSEVVAPATASFVAVIVSPALAVRSFAVSGGYGVQSQFVPRGTESPSATIDDIFGAADVVDPVDDVEQAVAAPRTIKQTPAQAGSRLRISNVICTGAGTATAAEMRGGRQGFRGSSRTRV